MGTAQAFVKANAERPETSLEATYVEENEGTAEVKDDKNLCTNNCQDDTFDMETLFDQHPVEEIEDSDADITSCSDVMDRIVQEEDPDATEYSSSFGGTMSGSEDAFNSSDVEVESQFHATNDVLSVLDRFQDLIPTRKKRLTAQWRQFIHPVKWRCKWIELRVKDLQSQASKYEQELLAYANEKEARTRKVASQSSARSMPFGQSRRKLVMQRRKRRRMEDTVDIPAYMSRHNLFAYYENRKTEIDDVNIDDDGCHQGFKPRLLQLQFGDTDSSMEQILWNIELLQCRIEKLKGQLNKVVHKNVAPSSSMENLSNFLPSSLPAGSVASPSTSPIDEDHMPVGGDLVMTERGPGHVFEYDVGDLVITESAVSSFGDATPLPDVIESTRGLLCATVRSFNQPVSGCNTEDIADDVLIHNQLEEELHYSENVHPPGGSQEALEEHGEKVAPEMAQMEEPAQTEEPEVDPSPVTETSKSVSVSWLAAEVSVPKNKRRRVARTMGSGRWHRGKVYKRRSK